MIAVAGSDNITGPHDLLIGPLRELLDAFGTAAVPPETDPGALVRVGARFAEDVHAAGKDAVAELAWAWGGPAAATALTSAERVVSDVLVAADRGIDIATIAVEGTVAVVAGAAELTHLVDSFASYAQHLAPVAGTPQGGLMLLTVAIEHIVSGLEVLTRVTSTLADLTDRMTALIPDTPAAPAGGGTLDGTDRVQGEHTPHAMAGARPGDTGTEVVLPDGSVSVAPNETAATAVRRALDQQGTPYVWGGTSPGRGLDCSALTQYAYAEAGVELPRLAQEQDVGQRVDAGSVLPGDLAVWDGHVAMVVGNGLMIEAGDPVAVSPIRTTNSGMAFEGFYRPTSG